MSSLRVRLSALSGTVIALVALGGCTSGEVEPVTAGPTTSSPAASPTASPSPSTTPDPWAGYFDKKVAAAGVGDFLWQSWGTFGDPDGVVLHRSENRTVEPGAYMVTLECAGPEMISGQISTSGGTTVTDALAVTCMASTPIRVDLPDRGLLIDLDSAGAPGAFLIQVSRAG